MGGVVKRPGESPPSTDFNCSVGNGELLQVFQGSNMFHLYMYACSVVLSCMFHPGIFKSIIMEDILGKKKKKKQSFETGRPVRRLCSV